MIDFWNIRYAENDFAYGKEPNQFLVENIDHIPKGKMLFPAEGEGRNAVYAAQKGYEVYAFDTSIKAKEKAIELDKAHNASINYQVGMLSDLHYPENSFDGIVLIYAHVPNEIRNDFHKHLIRLLKPGGVVLFEAFSKEQLNYSSGGPKDYDMLFSEKEIKTEFSSLQFTQLETLEIDLNEGKYHQGRASVVRFKATKL